MIEIPTFQNEPSIRSQTALDGVTYDLSVDWSERAEAWYLTINDVNGVPLASGIKLVLDVPLIGRHQRREARLPAGLLMLISLTDSTFEPSFEDLGARCKLVYYSSDEAAELRAGRGVTSLNLLISAPPAIVLPP